MHKGIYLLVVMCFFSWLLPLGYFIDKAKEAKVCGGQRAVCMCSANLTQKSSPLGKIELVPFSSHHEQRAPAGGAGQEFYLLPTGEDRHQETASYEDVSQWIYALLTKRSLDPVPRA